MEENQSPFQEAKIEEVTEKEEKPKELTTEFLQEKLKALEEAFEPFYNDCGFYSVEINLQGRFNPIIANAAKDYQSKLDANGYVSMKKGRINITLT